MMMMMIKVNAKKMHTVEGRHCKAFDRARFMGLLSAMGLDPLLVDESDGLEAG